MFGFTIHEGTPHSLHTLRTTDLRKCTIYTPNCNDVVIEKGKKQKAKQAMTLLQLGIYIYVICRPGGLYWEKLCQRSWVRPKAPGRGPNSKPRAQFFSIQTDLGRKITCLLFSCVEYSVNSFCVEFSLQPFSNLVYVCVWHLGNRKSRRDNKIHFRYDSCRYLNKLLFVS